LKIMPKGKSIKSSAPVEVREIPNLPITIFRKVVGGKNPNVAGRAFEYPVFTGEDFADAPQAFASFFDSDDGRPFVVASKTERESITGAAYVGECASVAIRTYLRNKAAGIARVSGTGERTLLKSLKKGSAADKLAAIKALAAKYGVDPADLLNE
jgi:hypothetical protein